MSRGVLLEKKGRRGVILTHDGTFESIRLRKPEHVIIGQTIQPAHVMNRRMNSIKKIFPAVAACLSLIIALLLFFKPLQSNAVAAYISFDLNPSIEAGVNEDMRIVTVKAVNHDAKTIIGDSTDYKDMSLKAFMDQLVENVKQKDYVKQQSNIVVTAALTDDINQDKKQRYLKTISSVVNKTKQQLENMPTDAFKFVKTTMAIRNKAKQKGMSAGKYLTFLDAKKQNRQLTLEKAKTLSVAELNTPPPSNSTDPKPANKGLLAKDRQNKNESAEQTHGQKAKKSQSSNHQADSKKAATERQHHSMANDSKKGHQSSTNKQEKNKQAKDKQEKNKQEKNKQEKNKHKEKQQGKAKVTQHQGHEHRQKKGIQSPGKGQPIRVEKRGVK
ncbi:anti-sigma-I factor RsgI family protein [Tuberibacillus sp. Marseille-P3662]|uniref:anti-sigma-I factor RsgI family protein n=1 Tax=Tuberibacillus sp. Marseille-P3662 TaxID=1965358 RepID=UPI000A1C82B4|nr:hypothetical protein [Tuberibacillus sp. Marseille-P3662]